MTGDNVLTYNQYLSWLIALTNWLKIEALLFLFSKLSLQQHLQSTTLLPGQRGLFPSHGFLYLTGRRNQFPFIPASHPSPWLSLASPLFLWDRELTCYSLDLTAIKPLGTLSIAVKKQVPFLGSLWTLKPTDNEMFCGSESCDQLPGPENDFYKGKPEGIFFFACLKEAFWGPGRPRIAPLIALVIFKGGI